MMDPVAFRVGEVAIYWYGILLACGLLGGFALALRNSKQLGLDTDTVESILFKLAVSLLIGARLGAIAADIDHYLANPSHVFLRSGLASHGGIIAVMLVGVYLTRRQRTHYWLIADAISPGIPLGHIFIRLGNYINGELYGLPSSLPWGVSVPGIPEAVHPLQLYEAAISVPLLLISLRWVRTNSFPGSTFARVMIAHSIVRFFLDFLRPQDTRVLYLSLGQWTALLFVVGLSAFYYKRRATAMA